MTKSLREIPADALQKAIQALRDLPAFDTLNAAEIEAAERKILEARIKDLISPADEIVLMKWARQAETDALLHDLGEQLGLAARLLPECLPVGHARGQVLYAIKRLTETKSALAKERASLR